jgi:hypothetical protein
VSHKEFQNLDQRQASRHAVIDAVGVLRSDAKRSS